MTHLMDHAHSLSRALTRGLVLLAGTALILSAVAIAFDIALRKTTSLSIPGTDEVGGYVFAGATAIGFSFALLENANVRIDSVLEKMPGRLRGVLEIVGLLALGLFALVLTWRAGFVVADSWAYDSRAITPLNTPLAVPQTMWLAGLILYLLNIVIVLALLIRRLVQGTDFPKALRDPPHEATAVQREI